VVAEGGDTLDNLFERCAHAAAAGAASRFSSAEMFF
jgi:hypothetical protein